MRTFESALDIIFVIIDFIVGALTIPLRLLFPNVPGISLDGKLVFGPYWGSALTYDKSDSWGVWFWVMLLGLVLAFM
jgi:hypothetical protein